jgi:putative membrane protein
LCSAASSLSFFSQFATSLRAPRVLHPSFPPLFILAFPVSLVVMLNLAANVLVCFLSLVHVFIFRLEALCWFRGTAKGFGVAAENVHTTAVLAANQGVYNLVLAAGLGWAVVTGDFAAKLWFSGAVLCVGLFGYITTGSAKILRAQCVPASLALALLFCSQTSFGHLFALSLVGGCAALSVALAFLVNKRIKDDHAFSEKKKAAGASKTQ